MQPQTAGALEKPAPRRRKKPRVEPHDDGRAEVRAVLRRAMSDFPFFVEQVSGLRLRSYQVEPALAILESVLHGRGRSFVVVFPRQSGKNELQAHLQAFLMTRLLAMRVQYEMVQIAPTWKPQALNAMFRLERVLGGNVLTHHLWDKDSGYIYRLFNSRLTFLSGHQESSIVGATASVLLSIDEAQDILISKFDKEIAPMAASSNATRVFWGTAWTSETLLARELRLARRAERGQATRSAYVLDAEQVAKEVPQYGEFVRGQVARLGRGHPLVRTQYYSQEIDAQGGTFPPERSALMQGEHPPLDGPRRGGVYALLVDVAGEDEDPLETHAELEGARRDSTAVTVVEVDLKTLRDRLIQAPSYRAVARHEWVGVPHAALYGRLHALAEHWSAARLVIDATGVGAGLASFLERALPGRVSPFVFTLKSKSDLGWGFLAAVETGRYREYRIPQSPTFWQSESLALQRRFWAQVGACRHDVLEGPGRLMRWGVPEGARDPESGEPLHDDLLVSAALCAALDGQAWSLSGKGTVIQGRDPLDGELEF